ncbi:MAG TPA: hypothetical protein PKA37_16980, partial [Planctomycetota bacterium]|nr:hypothetical protein [Planctomycetota bacterium]
MDHIQALRVSMVILFSSVSLLSQVADENLRFPIHPVWNHGQELLSEWRGEVLLVLAWDHKASRSHEVVSLAAHLSDRYLADGLSVILHHERDDKEAPIAA